MRRGTAAALLALIVVLGGALRLSHALALGGRYAPHVETEEGYYEAGLAALSCRALSLIADAAPTDYLAPTYPVFLALTESFFPLPSPAHARLAKALLSTLACAAAGLLAWRLFSPLAGVLAGALLAFNVDDILEVGKLNVHGFYGWGLLALGISLVLWLEKRDARRAALLGLMTASTLLCRGAHFPFPLLLAAACLWRWKFPEGGLRALLPVAAATALFLAPMALRNGLQFGNWSPFDLKGSCVFLGATIGVTESMSIDRAIDAAEAMEPGFKARGLEGRPLHKELIRLGMRQIRRAPGEYALYCARRFFLYWNGLWPYLALGLYALWRRRGDRALEALVLTAASLSGYAAAGAAPQFHVSAAPLLCVIAAAGLSSLPFAGKAAAEPAASARRLRAGAALLPGAFVVVYAAMLVFLGRELLYRPASSIPVGDPCPDGRARHALELASRQAGDRGPAAIAFAEHENAALYYPEPAAADAGRLRLVLNGLLSSRPEDGGLWVQRAELEAHLGERAAAGRSLARAARAPFLSGDLRRRIEVLGRELAVARGRSAPAPAPAPRRELRPSPVPREAPPSRSQEAARLIARAEGEARKGAREAALKSLSRAEEAKPDDDGRRRMALLYRRLEEPARALSLVESLLEALPGDAELWLERAELEAAVKGKEAALASLARAGEAKPEGELGRRLALDYQNLGEHARAIAALDELIRRRPEEGTYYSDRGLCRYLKGDAAGAIADLEAAIRLAPDFLPAYLSLGAVHSAGGRSARALKAYEEGLARAAADEPLRGALTSARAELLAKGRAE